MRVLVLGINYAPERTGIGPYTTRMAERLGSKHQVTVFAGEAHYPDWRAGDDRPRPLRRKQDINGVEVIRHRHYVPARQDAVRRAAYELSWASNTLRSAVIRPADVVIAVVPALFSGVVAQAVRSRTGAKVGIIVQDVMGAAAAQSGISGGGRVAALATRLEGWSLRAADSVVTIHPQFADALHEDFRLRARPHVIYNWAHVGAAQSDAAAVMRRKLAWRDDDVVVLHSGNMGLKQDLATVVDAGRLTSSQQRKIRFVLAGGGSQHRSLQTLANGVDSVDVIAGVSDKEFPALLAAADILLVNERAGMSSMSLPSKLTSYFTSGRPVIAATDADSATASFLRSTGAGLIIPAGDPHALVSAVEELSMDPTAAEKLGRRGQTFARTELSSEAALSHYEDWVESLGNNRAAP